MTLAPDAAPLLSVRGLALSYGHVRALVDVDLDVRAGEVVALVGDNAAGKSTLVKVVAGLLQPSAGTISLDGQPVAIPSPSAAHGLGIATVFQELAVCENLDVAQNLYLGKERRRTWRGRSKPGAAFLDDGGMEAEARELLASLTARIPSVRTPLSELSAGQRQSVAVARTLLGKPRIVLLDEPTASLSVAQTAEVLTLIESLRSMGLAVVLVSHNMNDVRAVADRVEVLRHGRNNGSFPASAPAEEILAAITGAR